MALTNVWRQNTDGEWVRTTAAQADREYSYSVSVNAAHFRCYSCFQYVTFVKGGPTRASHFKHSRGDINKDCEDRSQSISRNAINTPSDIPVPMRLLIQGGRARFQIGLLPICDEELNRAIDAKLTIIIRGNRGTPRVYRVDRSRFSPHITCWIDLPDEWIDSYQLCFEPSHHAPNMWKRKGLWIGDDGALFDVSTGRRMPDRSDIQVGKEYYYVNGHSVFFSYSKMDVSIERINVQGYNVWIYKVKVLRYSSGASDFCFDYLKVRLTQKPVEMEIVWPPVMDVDGVMTTNLHILWMLSRGEADLETFPRSGRFVQSTLLLPMGKAKLTEIHNVSTLQMVCAERYSQSIACLYVRPLEDFTAAGLPNLRIMEDNGNIILTNTLVRPPRGGIIHIESDVDGSAYVFDEFGFRYRKVLNAGEDERLIDVKNGETIVVRQGLDVVRKIVIGKPSVKDHTEGSMQPWKAREVPFPRRYAAILERLDVNSAMYQTIRSMLKKGAIPKDGLKYLQKMMEAKSDE